MADTKEKQLELQYQRYRQRKDEEIKRLVAEREAVEHRLGKTQQDLTKIQSHSKTQSQRVQGLLKDMQRMEGESVHQQQLLEEQQHMIQGLQRDVVALRKERDDMASDLEAAKATVAIYKEDFEKERSDRAMAAGKIDSLTQTAADSTRDLSELQAARERELEQISEELRVKAAQIKNYKKQVDGLKGDLHKAQHTMGALQAQRNEVVYVEQSCPSPDKVDTSSPLKLAVRDWLPFKRSKTRDESSLEKEKEKTRMKAVKRERERSMKEGKEKRRAAMQKMEETKLKVYLETELNRLENENMNLRTQLECTEAMSKSLVEKLLETEAKVSKATGSSVPLLQYLSPRAKDNTPPHSQGDSSRRGSSQFYVKDPRSSYTEDQLSHSGTHREMYQERRSSTEANHRGTSSALDYRALESTDEDYVNLPPVSAASSRGRGKAQSPVEVPHHKSPKPTPRTISFDPDRRGSAGITLDPHRQTVSMPAVVSGEQESDISNDIDEDIREAAEVVRVGRDKRTYTLTSIPFDPFLECLYCNIKFRYGEIQKYRKHVGSCTGGSAV